MNRQPPLPVALLIMGIAIACAFVIASGFLDPEWMLETIGLSVYLGAIVGMLVCSVLSFWFDLAGTIRRTL